MASRRGVGRSFIVLKASTGLSFTVTFRSRREYIETLLQESVISVPEISCEHCVKTITGALGVLPGVEAVTTAIPTKSVHVRYDSRKVSLTKVEEVLDDVSYTGAK
jgi:copper chaperone